MWICAGLWTVGGLLEHRPGYVALESIRLLATALAVLWYGAWFGGVPLPPVAQAAIAAAASCSLIALWRVFKQPPSTHGYLSHQ
jgi:hypothetical protein